MDATDKRTRSGATDVRDSKILDRRAILITGVSGCVGRATAALLARQGAVNIGFGRSKTDRSVSDLTSEYIEGDIRDRNRIESAIERADAVVHLAAAVHRELKGDDEEKAAREINEEATIRICEACAKRSKTLVFASTVAVYGESGGRDLKEDSPLRPETLYGRNKATAEKAVLDSGGIALRLPLVYGAHDRGNMKRMIRAILRNAFAVPGRGEATRSLIGRWNAAEAILCALTASEQKGAAFNVTDDENVSIGELADLIADLLNRPRPLRIPVSILKCAAAAGSIVEKATGVSTPLSRSSLGKLTNSLTVDDSQIRAALGFRPVKPLLQGLKEETDWCIGKDR